MKKIKVCPVCDSTKLTNYLSTHDYFLTQEFFNLSKCEDCGFVFTNPRPDDINLGSYYNSSKYLSHHTAGFSITRLVYKFLRKLNIRRKYLLIESFIRNGKILDVGCGTGEFLNYFKHQGWKVQGIEPNENARVYAEKNYAIPVDDESKLAELPAENYDVITLWHVLEHVPDLNKRMLELKKLLKPEGLLVIALPNLSSHDSKYYGKYWAALDVPRHLYHFTPDSFQKLTSRYDFKIIKQVPMKIDAYYVSLLSEKYRGKHCYYLKALLSGHQSNRKAKLNMQYSSLIYFIKNL